jgi:hypothetical protein
MSRVMFVWDAPHLRRGDSGLGLGWCEGRKCLRGEENVLRRISKRMERIMQPRILGKAR